MKDNALRFYDDVQENLTDKGKNVDELRVRVIAFRDFKADGAPPPPEEIVGTMNYYSPQLVGYIQEPGPGGGWWGNCWSVERTPAPHEHPVALRDLRGRERWRGDLRSLRGKGHPDRRQPMPAEAPSPPERAPREAEATEIPVRELPRRRPEPEPPGDGPFDILLTIATLLINLAIGVL